MLLITAFVLLIISGTALFAIQQGLWEMRASGAALQSVRTRYVAEAFLVSGLACVETPACIESKPEVGVWRAEYGIPARVSDVNEAVFELRPDSIIAGAMGFTTSDIIQTDDVLSGGGLAAVYTPDFRFVVEKWVLENPGAQSGSRPTERYIATSYGELDVVGDQALDGDTRQNNQSISVSRAYYQRN